MNYIPKPENTDSVILEEELEELVEKMAKNTHENWAKQRMEDGWKYGKKRNDEKKEHPCLIPYEELSEEEKEYDRITSKETLKFIKKHGYNIEKIK